MNVSIHPATDAYGALYSRVFVVAFAANCGATPADSDELIRIDVNNFFLCKQVFRKDEKYVSPFALLLVIRYRVIRALYFLKKTKVHAIIRKAHCTRIKDI